MNDFKYSLEKYNGPETRHLCPNCGKKEFTRYIDNSTGKYLADDIGRCNREEKCQYHKPPTSNINRAYNTRQIPPIQIQNTVSLIPIEIVKKYSCRYEFNDFVIGLNKIFTVNEVNFLINKFFLGTTTRAVIFWQIDQNYAVRSGKIMKYTFEILKRFGNPSWIHYNLKMSNFKLKQCLFGLHQLNKTPPENPIYIIESEKTAVIMSGKYPEKTWMATGGVNQLNKEKLIPLSKRKIFLFPDIGAEIKWSEKIKDCHNCSIVDWPKVLGINKADHQGSDLADFLSIISNKIFYHELP